jgi:hypothetical protein
LRGTSENPGEKLQIAIALRSVENISRRGPLNCRSLHFAPPDFLWNLIALVHFMAFPLQKGAHAALSSAAWQEIRVRFGRDNNGEGGAFICIGFIGWTGRGILSPSQNVDQPTSRYALSKNISRRGPLNCRSLHKGEGIAFICLGWIGGAGRSFPSPSQTVHQLTNPLLCHPDRSVAKWRDLQFRFAGSRQTLTGTSG